MLQKNKFTRIIHYDNLDKNLELNKELDCKNYKINYGEGNSLEIEFSKLDYNSYSLIYDSNSILKTCFWSSFKKNDILFIDSKDFLKENYQELIKLKTNNIAVLLWDGTFYNYSKYKEAFNLILTCSRSFKESYNNLNIKSEILYFSFSPEKYKDLILDWDKRIDKPAFLGSINIRSSSHYNRIQLLYNLRDKIDLYLNFGSNILIRSFWLLITKPSMFYKYLILLINSKKAKFGIDYFKEIGRRKIIINNHIDQTEFAANIRILEIVGMKSFMITDKKKDIYKILPANAMMIYKNSNEILFYLMSLDENEMQRVALNGYEYVLNNYSSKIRSRNLIDILYKNNLIDEIKEV